MRTCFIGGQVAGIVGLLTVMNKVNVISGVPYDNNMNYLLIKFGIPWKPTVNQIDFKDIDLLFCVHGKEIVSDEILKKVRFAVNVHPYLYCYKGSNPILRAIKNKNSKGSVGSHYMVSIVDCGEVIVETFIEINPISVESIYNQLYFCYVDTILKTIDLLKKK